MGLKYIYIYIFWARRPVSNTWNNRLPSNNHPLSPFWCERRNNHPRILFKEIRYVISFVFVYWKCPAENSGNGSSEPLNLKDFVGGACLPSGLEPPRDENTICSYFENGCRKNVHVTIPKGNMGYDQHCSCRTYFWRLRTIIFTMQMSTWQQ